MTVGLEFGLRSSTMAEVVLASLGLLPASLHMSIYGRAMNPN